MAQARKRRRPMSEINVVPYIDVMLVLLVIFMVTTPLLNQGVEVDLPRADAKAVKTTDGKILVVSVKADGSYYLNLEGDPQHIPDLEIMVTRVAALLRLHPGTPVHVGGDRNVAYGKVIQLIASLKKAGVSKIGFLTEPPHK